MDKGGWGWVGGHHPGCATSLNVQQSSEHNYYRRRLYNKGSGEELTLEMSAFQSLYGGQFTVSTPLINQIFVFHSPTDVAPQFL